METTETTAKTIKIARTRKGHPCLWESLVVFEDLKRSTVIIGADHQPKIAVYLNETQEKQALVPIVVGDYIAKAFEDKHGIAISIFRVETISSMTNEATIIPVFRKSSLLQDYDTPANYSDLIEYTVGKLQGKHGVVSSRLEKEVEV